MGNTCQSCTCCSYEHPLVPKITPSKLSLSRSQPLLSPTPTVNVVQDNGDGPDLAKARPSTFPQLTQQQRRVRQEQTYKNNSAHKTDQQQQEIRGVLLPVKCYYLIDRQIYYQGEWKRGLAHGRGKAYLQNSRIYYEGAFKQGFAHTTNTGLLIYPQGSYYVGPVLYGRLTGTGTYYNAHSNHVYVGQFLDDLPEGQGIQEYADGSKYEGGFKRGRKSKHGVYRWADGRVYEGEWRKGQMHGHGRLSKGRAYYEGPFDQGAKSSTENVQMHTDTGTYTGQFIDGKMGGKGVFEWNDGKVYRGGFRDGEMHGRGVIEYPGGQMVVGRWEGGLNVGVDRIARVTDRLI